MEKKISKLPFIDTPEQAKKLEEAKKNAKEMDKYLERLIKNPKDEEAKKGLEECAKKLQYLACCCIITYHLETNFIWSK